MDLGASWTTDTVGAAAAAPTDAESLIAAYEQSVRTASPARSKRRGVFYTPSAVADYLAEHAVPDTESRDGRPSCILDPACGAGRLLLRAYRRLAREARTLRERLEALKQIYGIDIDASAIDVARRALLVEMWQGLDIADYQGAFHQAWTAGEQVVRERVRVGDSLEECTWLSAVKAAAGAWPERFDAILANPPYGSYSGRHAIASRPSKYAGDSSGGWATRHGHFVDLALRLVERRGGRIAMIVPGQVGHLCGYAPLRQRIYEAGLLEVRYWGERVFPGVITPAMTFVLKRGHQGSTTIAETCGRSSIARLDGSAPWRVGQFHHRDALLRHLHENALYLGKSIADPGVHTGNRSRELIVAPEQLDEAGVEPILEGRRVDRYRCLGPARGLRCDYPADGGAYFRIGRPQVYRRARFLVRQTAARPIAGPREGALYFRNSLLALYEPDGIDIRYVVGILNSRLGWWMYRQMVMESTQRAFPQVKVGSLRKLPFPGIHTAQKFRDHDRLVTLVQRMLDLYQHSHSAQQDSQTPTQLNRCIAKTDAQIDAQVYKLYGLGERQISMIEADLSAPPPSGSTQELYR